MFGPIRAVAVDDEPGHLLSITTGLSSVGIPCTGYWFDRETADLQPSPPAGGLPHLRLLFTDLNLHELGPSSDTAALWSVIVAMLHKLVSPDGGPYILVFWTRLEGKSEEVAAMLYERADKLKVPPPLHVIAIKKGAFLPAQPKAGRDFNEQLREFYDSLISKIDDLKKVISETVAAQPVINTVSAWESRAAEAAASTVNHVHRCGAYDAEGPKVVAASMSKILGRIATASAGEAAATAQPARALDAGLLDILIDQFGASVDLNPYKESTEKTIGDLVKDEIKFRSEIATYADLNTFFHVDQFVESVKNWDRGAVLAAKKPYNKGNLGFNPTELVDSEFLFLPEMLFPPEQPERRAAAKEHLRAARHAADVVLIELGADCDHAQDHNRTRRFLVGLEVLEEHSYLIYGEGGKLRNGALELLGPWKIKGAVKYLLVSCRRFWTHQLPEPPPGEIKYRLRASVVSKLLHRYASWSSRPGIVEFR